MIVQKLKDYLDEKKIKYVSIKHSPAFTAQDIAESAHISGKKLAKTVVVKVDNTMVMAVLSATKKLNIENLKKAANATVVEIATENDFRNKFPGCENGAFPPFGNLYDMKVFVDEELSKEKEIGFNAGSHTEIIKLEFADFKKLVQPKIAVLH